MIEGSRNLTVYNMTQETKESERQKHGGGGVGGLTQKITFSVNLISILTTEIS